MKDSRALMQWPLVGGTLGCLQGLIMVMLVHAFSPNLPLISALTIFFAFPVAGLLFKLSALRSARKWLSILCILGVAYALAGGHWVHLVRQKSIDVNFWLLKLQLQFSMFIVFAFYCALVESEKSGFSYAILFRESWQLLQKLFLGSLLMMLLYGLCILAGKLFNLLNIHSIDDLVYNADFKLFIFPLFFGISLAILQQHEELLKKMRAIFLAFCHLLYPLFVIISLSFLLTIPFSTKNLTDIWPMINLLAVFNVFLINGVFQQGDWARPPYRKILALMINILICVMTAYLIYDLQFPLKDVFASLHKATGSINQSTGSVREPIFSGLCTHVLYLVFTCIMCAYHIGYSYVALLNQESWLDRMKRVNIILAGVIAFVYWALIFPWGFKSYFL